MQEIRGESPEAEVDQTLTAFAKASRIAASRSPFATSTHTTVPSCQKMLVKSPSWYTRNSIPSFVRR